MKFPNYKEMLTKGEEAIEEALAIPRVHRARKQAELKLAEIEEEIATKTAELQENCCEKELDFEEILDMQDEIGLLERRKEQFLKMLDEMFPSVLSLTRTPIA